jgi:hypothetical protein
MRRYPCLAAGALAALLLAGCAGSDYGTKQTVGALAGAGAGGLLGAQIGDGKKTRLAATAAGTLLGALLGSEVGKSLDRADRTYASEAQYEALETSRPAPPAPGRTPTAATTAPSRRPAPGRPPPAATAASFSTARPWAGAPNGSTAPPAARRTANGRL